MGAVSTANADADIKDTNAEAYLEASLEGAHPRVARSAREAMEEAQKEARAFREKALRSVDIVINESKPHSFYEEQSAKASDVLRGIRIPTDIPVEELNLGEMGDMGGEILANALTEVGIENFNSADIRRWRDVPLAELGNHINFPSSSDFAALKDNVQIANAQLGADFTFSAASTVQSAVGLYATTREALEDGNISGSEAAQMASSAVSLGSSIASTYAAGASVGPVGVAAACAVAAYMYIDYAFNAAEAKLAREVESMRAKSQAHQEYMNAWEEQAATLLRDGRVQLWGVQDITINKVARVWNLMERKLGVRFDLRYFPGEPPPSRGGLKTIGPGGGIQTVRSAPCSLEYGCLYFPDRDVPRSTNHFLSSPIESDVEYLESPGRSHRDTMYYVGDKLVDSDYEYYARTVRAMEALVKPDSTPENPFALPTAKVFYSNMERTRFENRFFNPKYYYNWVSQVTGFPRPPTNATHINNDGTRTTESMYLLGQNVTPPGSANDRGIRGAAGSMYHQEVGDNGTRLELKMKAYYEEAFTLLSAEAQILSPISTRVIGDLITTSNTIQSEMAVANTFRHVFDQTARYIEGSSRKAGPMGALGSTSALGSIYSYPGKPSIQERVNTPVSTTAKESIAILTPEEQDEIPIFDDVSKDEIRARRAAEKRNTLINAGALGAGGIAAYLGNRR